MEYNLKTADFADYADFKNAQAHCIPQMADA